VDLILAGEGHRIHQKMVVVACLEVDHHSHRMKEVEGHRSSQMTEAEVHHSRRTKEVEVHRSSLTMGVGDHRIHQKTEEVGHHSPQMSEEEELHDCQTSEVLCSHLKMEAEEHHDFRMMEVGGLQNHPTMKVRALMKEVGVRSVCLMKGAAVQMTAVGDLHTHWRVVVVRMKDVEGQEEEVLQNRHVQVEPLADFDAEVLGVPCREVHGPLHQEAQGELFLSSSHVAQIHHSCMFRH